MRIMDGPNQPLSNPYDPTADAGTSRAIGLREIVGESVNDDRKPNDAVVATQFEVGVEAVVPSLPIGVGGVPSRIVF